MRKKIFMYVLTVLCTSLIHADYIKIPTIRLKYDLPHAETEINGQKFFLLVDTGSSAKISLNQRLTEGLDLIYTGDIKTLSRANGAVYNSSEIIIPEIKIGGALFTNIVGREDGSWLDEGSLKKEGILGEAFYRDFYTLFNLQNNKIILSKDLSGIEEAGFYFNRWTELPFKMTDVGIVLELDIAGAPAKFVLDSGSSHTVIKQSFLQYHNLKELNAIDALGIKINNVITLDLKEPSEIDGFIGIGFFNTHKVLFDFKKERLFLQNRYSIPY